MKSGRKEVIIVKATGTMTAKIDPADFTLRKIRPNEYRVDPPDEKPK